jgi:hypothetical protein
LPPAIIEDSTNNPPLKQWLGRLDVGAVLFVFIIVIVSVRWPAVVHPQAVAREVGSHLIIITQLEPKREM